MDGELASVQEVIAMTPQEALDSAQAFLTRQDYRVVRRTEGALTVERRLPAQAAEQRALVLTVLVSSEPEGGVRIRVRGNDREGVQQRRDQWIEWSEGLPKRLEEGQEHLPERRDRLPVPSQQDDITTVPDTQESGYRTDVASPTKRVIFDRQDQLEKIRAGLLPGEELEAVFDVKGGGTGFVGITSKRVIFQDNAWVTNTKAVVSIPYGRIHTIAAEDQVGLLTGRGYFSSSKIVITTSAGPKAFQFRGADKAHVAHDMILRRII